MRGITVSNELVSLSTLDPGSSHSTFSADQSVWDGGVIIGNTVEDEGTIYVQSDGQAYNTTVGNNGRLSVSGLIADTTVKLGGSVNFDANSRSQGELVIEKGGEVSVDNNDYNYVDVTSHNPLVPSNIYLEKVKLAGNLDINPSWLDGDEEDFASTPDRAGVPLVTTIGELTMQGGQIGFAAYGPSAQFNRLDIDYLSGQGSFYLNTQIASGAGDMINVRQRASGDFQLFIQDTGKEPAGEQKVVVAHTNSGDAHFSLANSNQVVELGTYQYVLQKSQNGESSDWYLQDKQTTSTTGTDKGVLSYSAASILSLAAAPRQVMHAESLSFSQRQGNYYQSSQQHYGLWTRYLHDNSHLNDADYTAFTTNLNGMQIGLDTPVALSDSETLLLGVFTGLSHSTISMNSGKGTIDSYHGGIYATYLNQNGLYIDGVLKGNQLNNYNRGNMLGGRAIHGDYRQHSGEIALETGYRLPVTEHIAVMPYGRVQYSLTGSAHYQLDNTMSASIKRADSLQGELGTLMSSNFAVGNTKVSPYLRLAVTHEFSDDNDIILNNQHKLSNDFSGSTGKYGVGVDVKLSPLSAFYTEINYQQGNKIETPLHAVAGFRIEF